jgi:hypothetical protein
MSVKETAQNKSHNGHVVGTAASKGMQVPNGSPPAPTFPELTM